jgi:hypothetical protein
MLRDEILFRTIHSQFLSIPDETAIPARTVVRTLMADQIVSEETANRVTSRNFKGEVSFDEDSLD